MPARLPLRWLGPAGVLLLALLARLWHIDLTRFFNDQVDHIASAARFVDTGSLPLSSGFTFAVGTTGAVVRIPALVTYLLAPPALLSRDPVWLSGYVAVVDALAAPLVYLTAKRIARSTFAGVAAGSLYALLPSALLFGRVIWNPDLVPFFAAAALLALVTFVETFHMRALGVALVAICCAAELHVVNAVFLALWLVVAVAARKNVRSPLALALPAGVVVVTLLPYLYLQTQSGWSDVLNLGRYLSRPKMADAAAIDQAMALLGPTIFDRFVPPAGGAVGLLGFSALTWVCAALLLLGIAATRQPPLKARGIVVAWALLPVAAAIRHAGDVVPHYLLATLPADAILMGLGLEYAAQVMRRAARTRAVARHLGWPLLAAVLVLLGVRYTTFLQRVGSNVRENDYGMPLRYSLAAAGALRSHVSDEPVYLAVPFLWERTVPALAGLTSYSWYWDRSVLVFPRTAAWYLIQNDSFGHTFLTANFSPPAATVMSSQGAPEFSLFHLPPDAPAKVFGAPGFMQLNAREGSITLLGLHADALAAGQSSQLLLEWQIADAAGVPGHLSQFAHLVDSEGKAMSADVDLYDIREPWRTGDVVASAIELHVQPNVQTGGYWIETGFYDTFSRQPLGSTVRVGPLKIAAHEPAANAGGPPLATLAGGELALAGATWQGTNVTVDWRALRKPAASYTVFVHAVDASGRLLAQWDGVPRGGSYPTTLWDAGEVVRDEYPLGLAASPGVRLEIGMYTQPDVRRLPVDQAGQASDHVTIDF